MDRIIIVGAGLSGMSAALTLARAGRGSILVSPMFSERAQSVMAEGGINAALNTMGEGDLTENHFQDTLKGGVNLADPEAVRGLCDRAPEIVMDLYKMGVPFNLNEDGSVALRNFGGQKLKRTAFAKSSTGKVMVTALIDECRKYEEQGLIKRLSHHRFVRLILDESGQRLLAIRIRDIQDGSLLDLYGRTILACGGLAGFYHSLSTGSVANTGDTQAIAFMQGVKFSNLEMVQYHPTTMSIPGKRGLISEAARGEGGRLFILRGDEPWYYMEEKYPELGNLMPRDVVSRESFRVLRQADTGDQIFLDLRGLSEDIWTKRLSDLREEIIHYLGIDPATEPVPVEPGIHYFMGGLDTDVNHRTNIDGLYAVGESTSQYHGANRLGGNSLLGAVYGGRKAAEHVLYASWESMEGEQIRTFEGTDEYACESRTSMIHRLSDILARGMAIERCEEEMATAVSELEELINIAANEVERARIIFAKACIESARIRKESRGAHTRSDFPNTDPVPMRTLAIYDGGVKLSLAPIGSVE